MKRITFIGTLLAPVLALFKKKSPIPFGKTVTMNINGIETTWIEWCESDERTTSQEAKETYEKNLKEFIEALKRDVPDINIIV